MNKNAFVYKDYWCVYSLDKYICNKITGKQKVLIDGAKTITKTKEIITLEIELHPELNKKYKV